MEPYHSDKFEEIANQAKLYYCTECGKCVAACPMPRVYRDFSYKISPRYIISSALLGLKEEILEDEGIWFCLDCNVCTEACPAGVRFADFVQAFRPLAIDKGNVKYCLFCESCGQYYSSTFILSYLKEVLKERLPEQLTICPKCRRRSYAGKVKSSIPIVLCIKS